MRKLLRSLGILHPNQPPFPRSSPHHHCTSSSQSSCSWRQQLDSTSLGQLPSSAHLKRLIRTTHFPACVGSFSLSGIRLFHFSLQKKTGFGGAYLRRNTNGWRSFMSTSDGVLYGLIGANVSVFLLWRFADPTFMTRHFMISVTNIMNWRFHTLITSSFSHMDTYHIFANMIGLYVFGSSIGHLFGPQFLLRMYIGGAVSGSVFYLIHQVFFDPSFQGIGRRYYPSTPGLGASGAVNAIMLFNIFLFPKDIIYLQFFIPVPAALVGAALIGNDLWRVKQGDQHVSGSAHLGGALVAALVWARMIKHWI